MNITIVKLQRHSGTRYKAIIRDNDRVLVTKTFARKTDASTWGTHQLRDAERLEALGNPKSKMLLSKLIEQYMEEWEGRDESRASRMQALADTAGDKRLLDITVDFIRDDLEAFAKGRRPATANRRKAAWSALFKYAQLKRLVKTNPAKGIPALSEDNKRVRYLSDAERKALLAACEAASWPLLRLLVVLAMTTGARLGELLSLRWEGIDFAARTAYLPRTKNGDPRTLVFPPPAITELLKQRQNTGLVFAREDGEKPLQFRKHWNKALKAAGLENFRFHDLRHDAASQMAMAGATLLEIGEVLGHRSTETTKRYSHLSVERKRAVTDRVMGNVFGRLA